MFSMNIILILTSLYYVLLYFVFQVISTMMAGIEEITGVRGDFYIRVGSILLSSELFRVSLCPSTKPSL